jgi:threonine/homoserine efflux transporter RhtA
MNDSSRTQGGLICVGVAILGAWFLLGLLQESYWALAIPVAVLVCFGLGLTFWVGYTIATIQVEPFEDEESTEGDAASGDGSSEA